MKYVTMLAMKGLFLALLMIEFLLLNQISAQDWPRFRGSPTNNAPLVSVTPSSMQLAWEHRLPSEVVSSPVIANNIAYISAENGNLYAINLISKKLLWLFHSGGALSSTPAVANGQVFVLSRAGKLHAIDAQTGIEKWSFATGGEHRFAARRYLGLTATDEPVSDPWDYWLSSPLVAEGKVYFGSSDHHVYALDAENGKLIWAFKTGGEVHSSPALADNRLLIGSWDGALYALDAQNGNMLWKYQTETEQKSHIWRGIQSSPVIDDKQVYIGSRDGYMYALNIANGKQLWRYDVERSWVVPTPAVDDSQLYFGTSDSGLFIALNKFTGEENWRANTDVWTYSSAVVAPHQVMVGNMKGDFYAFSKKTGEITWRYQSDAAKQDFYAVQDKQTGKFDFRAMQSSSWYNSLYSMMQRILHSGGFLGSAAVSQQQLLLVTSDGQLLLFSSEAAQVVNE